MSWFGDIDNFKKFHATFKDHRYERIGYRKIIFRNLLNPVSVLNPDGV
jgi:hypothetical protein